jgi:hypothetical protein
VPQREHVINVAILVTRQRHLMNRQDEGSPRVLVIGAGTRLLSAMTYYTLRLTNALTSRFTVAFIPMRQLIPTFLYPGPSITVFDGIDWF